MKAHFILVFLLLSGNILAQRTLEATILDGMTRQPVEGAHVYLDGTTIGTTTNSQGKFSLTVRNAMNTSLVISHLLYETIIIPEPFQHVLPKVFYLEENISDFEEVVISAKNTGRLKRAEMLDVFRRQLLGFDYAARTCKILNENDIVLIHDKENQVLRAYAQKPLEIVNNYLKYRISWRLIEFKIEYTDQTLSDKSIYGITYFGTASFIDIGNNSETLRIRRHKVLQASLRNFFKLIATHKMKFNNLTKLPSGESYFSIFLMRKNIVVLKDSDDYFEIKEVPDDPSMKLAIIRPEAKHSINEPFIIVVTPESQISPEAKHSIHEPLSIFVIDEDFFKSMEFNKHNINLGLSGNKYYSKLTFQTDSFLIDKYGNTNLFKNLHVFHKFARSRLGDLLPFDYEDVPLGGNQALIDAPEPENDVSLNVEERIDASFLRQLQYFPQEKIYVHTDKSNYFGGETVWFRIYLADYATHKPTEAQSRYVYGELFNPVDSLMQRVKIHADSAGVFYGHFDLPATIATGKYRLRFYTRYMEESGEEYFFNRQIHVRHVLFEYEYNNMLCRQYLTIPSLQSDYSVSFFPEGGTLLSGVPVRVAFKALHSGGLSEQVSGKVYNEKGDTVAVFSSNPLGMGSFSFSPRKGEKYAALCRNSYGAEKRFDLPVIDEHSINLKAEWNNNRLSVRVIHSAGLILPDSMRLLIHCRGVLFYNELWTSGETIIIRGEQFPSGVTQLLLVDKNLNPVSERLAFHLNEQDMARVAVSPDKKNYGAREAIRTLIHLTSHDSIPLKGSFSVSVTADKDVQPDTANHILSSLLLASELKGYVERPAWYFAEGRLEEMDHLLLTQGWSRYDISAVLKGNIHKPAQLAETLPEISGRVTSGLFLQNRGEGYYVIMSEAGNKANHKGAISSLQDGRFSVAYTEKPNGATYTLQLVFPPNSIRAEMQIDPVVYPALRIRLPHLPDATHAGFDTASKNAGSQYLSGDGELARHLEEVVITAKRLKGIHPLSPGRMQDRIIPLEELNTRKKSAKTLHQLLMSAEEVNIRRDANGDLRVRYNHGLYYYDYVFVVDGKWWPMYSSEEEMKTYVHNNVETILSLPTGRLEEIEIVRAPAPPISLKDFGNVVVNDPTLYGIKEKTGIYEHASTTVFGHTGYLGTILITTKARNGGLTDDKKGRSLKITPLGYQVKKEFYSPAYETAEQQSETTPDLRSTIYWNPNVRTNEDGEAEISFYAADPETTYTVTIEGITDDGVLIRKTAKMRRDKE